MAPAAGQEEIRRQNLGAVLRYVHVHGPTSRAELTSHLGLNRSTIGALAADLAASGLVTEEPLPAAPARRAGRPSLVVSPRSAAIYANALSIEPDRLRAARVGLGGHLLDVREAPRPPGAGLSATVAALVELVHAMRPAGDDAFCIGGAVAVADTTHTLHRPTAHESDSRESGGRDAAGRDPGGRLGGGPAADTRVSADRALEGSALPGGPLPGSPPASGSLPGGALPSGAGPLSGGALSGRALEGGVYGERAFGAEGGLVEALDAALVAPGQRGFVAGDLADIAALAEHTRGVAAGIDDLLYLHGDLGVSAGIVTGGRLVIGHRGHSGKVGHMVVNPTGRRCGCGSRGCWETEIGTGRLLQLAGLPPDSPDGPHAVVRAAARGDQAALASLDEVGDWLGFGVANLVNVFNPDIVIFGGTLAEVYEAAAPAIRRRLDTMALPASREHLQLRATGLGENAALIGAAELAFDPLLNDPLTAAVDSRAAGPAES
ncbi:ROK family protein [Actinoplanes sp. NPDC051494]|uniref:ROK family transcriptional regulator n=1 Tax=Actinoplanes sp. NPDC051494 TaxID=3363907 RepID=UPI0037B87822